MGGMRVVSVESCTTRRKKMQFGRSSLVISPVWVRYGVAIFLLATAAVLRLGLGLIVNRPLSAPLFLAAIIISTWLGGFRLGLFASILAAGTLDIFFARPLIGTLEAKDHIARFLLFSVEGSMLSWLIDKLRLASEAVVVSREELRELSDQQRSVRDAEQKRIAREIHDELGQELTGLKLRIHLLKRRVVASIDGEASAEIETEIDGLSKQVDYTIGSVRRIATDLRPSVLDDFGLVAAIDWQTKEFGERSGIECIFNSNVSTIDLDADSNTAVFRIFQEALTNVARHAKATRVRVKLELRGTAVSLSVLDNGAGIDKEVVKRRKSLGMLGMRERARLLGGNVTVDRLDGGGTRVELIAPLKNPALAIETGVQE